jgi:predicted ATPase/class 3 adenylate cyclase/tetratricopeptide (TPR) repeat protein
MNNVRALLLTDIVDSTQLVETLGDDAAAALGAAHDRVARDLLRDWRGLEIDKTDGMLVLFDSVADAVGCAVAYHHALAALEPPLKARAGLHVGPVLLRENPPEDVRRGAKPVEVEGIAKPTAARVMSLALGGQTLITEAARAALGETALRVQSHGHWRIKGLAEPAELFEVGDTSAPFSPPPDAAKAYRVVQRGDLWLPVRQVQHSLSAERDAFVGRQDALADLARRFDAGARLVSLLGIGGTGKTRLARRFAWIWLGEFPGGAWFCDLSPARNVDGIVHAVAQGLDVPLGIDDPVVQLGHAIAGRGPCLVILDNFEQITRFAEATLGRWLDRAPQARFLVTTREVLGLPGEEALALAPLGMPDAQALFNRRAASAKRDYQPANEDQAAIPQLVKLLDGLPLAIELAAARVRVMSPRALLSRMDQRFKLLVAAGGRQDRQATLRAAFDWSWDLLTDAEKSALAQLSVFAGSFSLEAAECVLDLSGCGGEPWVVDVLQSLVDKSFVRPLDTGRFDLLGSVQDYAAEHLRLPTHFPGSGPAAERAAHERHGVCFARLAAPLVSGSHGVELDNTVVACRRAVSHGAADVAVATLEGAWSALRQRGPFGTGVELAQVVSQMSALDAAARARVAHVAGAALDAGGSVAEAQRHLLLALADARTAHEAGLEAQLLVALGDLHINQGAYEEAKTCHAAALSIARAAGLRAVECGALNGLGSADIDLGRIAEARASYLEALDTARAVGDRQWEGLVLGNLGGLLFNEGALDEAMQHFGAALGIARAMGDRKAEGNTLSNLGALHQMQARLPESMAASREALDVARDIGHVRLECIALCNLGLVKMDLLQWQAAQADFDAALALARRSRDLRCEGMFLGYLGQLHARQHRLEAARDCLETGERLLRQVSDRYSLGLLLCQRVELECIARQAGAADAALDGARQIADALGCGAQSEFGVSLAKASRLVGELQVGPASAGEAAATSGS